MDTSKPKVQDILNYIGHLNTVKDSLLFTQLKSDFDGPDTDRQRLRKTFKERYQNREQQLIEATQELVSTLSALNNEISQLDIKVGRSTLKAKAKANELTEAKYKFKSLLGQSDSGILTKAESLDENLYELEEIMKKRKGVKNNLFKIDFELTNMNMSIQFIELDNEIKSMGNNAESGRLNNIREQKEELLENISNRLSTLQRSIHNLRDYSKKANKLQIESRINNQFSNSTENIGLNNYFSLFIDNLQVELEDNLRRKIEEGNKIRERLFLITNMAEENIELTNEFEDYSFLIEEITVEIEDKENLRVQLLQKLKEKIIENIKLRLGLNLNYLAILYLMLVKKLDIMRDFGN